MSSNTYKVVTLYDASKPGNRSMRILKSDFMSDGKFNEEAAKQRISELRDAQKKANKLYKGSIQTNIDTVNTFNEAKAQRENEMWRAKTGQPPTPPTLPPPTADSGRQLNAALYPSFGGASGSGPRPTVKHKKSIDLDINQSSGHTCVLFGSSKRGKSTLMMHIYKKYYNEKNIIATLFSGNPHINVVKGYSKLLTTYGFTDEHAKYIMMQQYINVKTHNEYKFVELFDDIIDQKHSESINKCMLTYRNANISILICLQYFYLLSKQNRASVNATIVFGMNSIEDIKGILVNMLGSYLQPYCGSDEHSQITFFKQVTADHGFIYINNLTGDISFHRLNL